MMNVSKDISKAKKIILNNKRYFKGYKKYSVIPIKGTENVKELFSLLDDIFQFVLIVTGSGDQILEALLHGSKNITCFDINHLAKYGCELKMATVKALDYQEFVYFYSNRFPLFLYQKICNYLDGDNLLFWNSLFNSVNNYDIHSYLFDSRNHLSNELIDTNFSIYSEKEYYIIKENLKGAAIQYVDGNLLSVVKQESVISKKYSMIYLSNIFYYLGKSEKYYSRFIKQSIIPLLDNNGEVFIHYLYGQAGKKITYDVMSKMLWLDYNQETVERLENYLNLKKYKVSMSGYGNPVGDKDVILSLKKC